MIDISQLIAQISAFRVETEKSAIKRVQYQAYLIIAEREQIIQRIHLARNRRFDKVCSKSSCTSSGVQTANLCHTVGKILQDITDLLATAIGENEYSIIRFWKETLQQFRFIYDIQQRTVEDHNFVMLSLMTLSLLDGAASSLTPAIGPASRNRTGMQEMERLMFTIGAILITKKRKLLNFNDFRFN